MQNYVDFRKSIQDFLRLNPSPSSADTITFLGRLENQVFNICSSLDLKIGEQNNDLIKALKERIDLGDQLNMTKEATNKIIKCYNPRRMNPSLGSDEFRSVPIGIRRSFSEGARKLSNYRRIPDSGIDIGS
ncbi:unnamed protein product [Rotaria socialis]|uniref:Uncharacterized protein n=2 Tax=Rotaria socialis TaxID=392032 RepID=A0A819AL82_9BILA|nr:unnamed protein product [Rotaria socialis]CAF3787131.1 unnamed protein product [Rotaria socialis]CAF4521008.1 unnamed protein product [Rotaria socialis]CAF4792790.1 unnamed protein product [Rotaria socialis]